MTYKDISRINNNKLERKLGLGDSVFLVVGAVFGSGIFLTSGVIAGHLPSPGLIWLIWIAGGAMMFVGATIYSELGALYPGSGGPYVYLREAFGEGVAFLFGWAFFWIISGGGVAALAVGFAEYFGSIVPAFSSGHVFWRADILGFPVVANAGQLAAIAAILVLSALNAAGIRTGARFQSVMTVFRIVALSAFVILGLTAARAFGGRNLDPLFPAGRWPSLAEFGAAFLAVVWSYDGWYAVNCTAEEIRNPGRTIPRSLLLGTATVTGLYLASNIVYSMALSVKEMSGVVRIGFKASEALFGPSAAVFFTVFISAAIFGCLDANILFCPRVAFAMARDGLFFRGLGRINRRFGSPSRAVLAQGLWASLLCFGGTYGALIEFVSFALVLFFAATGIALIVLRKKDAERPRPFRVWGYPWLPGLFALVNLGISAAVLSARPGAAVAGLALILAGLPTFLLWKRSRPIPARASADGGESA